MRWVGLKGALRSANPDNVLGSSAEPKVPLAAGEAADAANEKQREPKALAS
jgi:hypothetical protein